MRKLWLRWAVLLVFVVALGAVFIRLGEWQLHRLEWRKESNAIVVTNRAKPVQPWAAGFDHTITDADQWQRVAVSGTFDTANQLIARYRSNADVKGSEIGLPEVSLGLLPGGGGIARTVRMFGLQKALMEVLLQGQRRKPAAALEVGLVDELAADPDAMLAAAKAWIKANPECTQSWDVKGYKIPGGTPSNPKFAAMLPAFPANLRKQIANEKARLEEEREDEKERVRRG